MRVFKNDKDRGLDILDDIDLDVFEALAAKMCVATDARITKQFLAPSGEAMLIATCSLGGFHLYWNEGGESRVRIDDDAQPGLMDVLLGVVESA